MEPDLGWPGEPTDDNSALIGELARAGAMTDCDLSEYPADKLGLELWSPTTLCGQRWLRVATTADKDALDAANPGDTGDALCGRCGA